MKTLFLTRLPVLFVVVAFCFSSNPLYSQAVVQDTAFIDQLYTKSKKFWATDNDSSRYYLLQVEALSKAIKYTRGEAYALYGYGVIENVLYKQFEYFTQSLDIFEKLEDKHGIGLNLIRIGYIYELIGQSEKALEYYKQSLVVKKAVDDFGGIALALINIGHYYQYKGEFEEALKFYEESLIYRLKEGTFQGIGFSLVNISEALSGLNDTEKALIMADSAVHNFSLSTNLNGLVWATSLKGLLLKKLEKHKEAEMIFETITHFPEKVQYNKYSLLAKKELVEMYSKQGNLQKAFQMQSEYLIAKDSLAKLDYRTETQRLVNEYEFKEQEQKVKLEMELKEKQIAKRNSLEYLSIAVIVLLLFVVLFSGRKKLSEKIVNGFLLMGLLLLFEFLLILSDSPIESITQGEPILKLLANVVIALLILPGHQFLDRYSRKRLL